MKRYYLIAAGLLLLAACKPSEKHYRAAYEATMAKRAADAELDSLTGGHKLITSGSIRRVTVGDVTMETRAEYVRPYHHKDLPDSLSVERYSIVAAQFRQAFNARSMATQLHTDGYESLVVQNAQGDYYVLAGTSSMAVDALTLLRAVEKDSRLHLKAPCPWVLQAAQLMR